MIMRESMTKDQLTPSVRRSVYPGPGVQHTLADRGTDYLSVALVACVCELSTMYFGLISKWCCVV